MSFLNYFGFSYLSINVVASAIFFIGVYSLARTQRDPLGFLILLFPILVVNMPMSAVRQSAAIGIICIALVSYIKRNRGFYFFWVVVASGFHSSAFAFISLLPTMGEKYTIKNKVFSFLLLLLLILFVLVTPIIETVSNRYFFDTNPHASGGIYRTGFLAATGTYFILFLKSRWKSLYPDDLMLVTIGSIGMVLIFGITIFSSVIGDRLAYYLIPIQAMIFSRIPFLSLRNQKELHFLFPYVILTFMFFYWAFSSNLFNQCYLPYRNWLFSITGI